MKLIISLFAFIGLSTGGMAQVGQAVMTGTQSQSIAGTKNFTGTLQIGGVSIGSLYQPLDSDLTIYASITPSANVQTILGAANYSAMRTSLSLVPGTDVQAYNATLAAVAANSGTVNFSGLTLTLPTGQTMTSGTLAGFTSVTGTMSGGSFARGVQVTGTNGITATYIPSADTDAARGTALIDAVTAAGAGAKFNLPAATHQITSTITIKGNQSFNLNGGTITHTSTYAALPIFSGSNVAGWSIVGPGTIQGSWTSGAYSDAGEKGISAVDCSSFQILNVKAKNFQSPAFYLRHDGITIDGTMSYGTLVGNKAENCYTGLYLHTRAEYNTITDFQAVGGTIGIKIQGGNNVITDAICTVNTYGVWVDIGTNHGHGRMVNSLINHSTFRAAYVAGIDPTLGYTFLGCTFRAGKEVELRDCGGVNFIACELDDASDIIATNTLTGINTFQNCFFPTAPTITATTPQRYMIKFRNCTTQTGMSALNDPYDLVRTAVTSGTYTALSTDEYIGVTGTAGAVINLTGTGLAGRRLIIQDEGGLAGTNAITLSSTTGTVSGTVTISTNYGRLTPISNGSNWFCQ